MANPMYAALEMMQGVSIETSVGAKIQATTIAYLGLGKKYNEWRDKSVDFFKVNKESIGALWFHDGCYTACFNTVIIPPMYLISQLFAQKGISLPEVIEGVKVGIGMGFFGGPFLGYSVDVFKDLGGIEECKRKFYPDFIKKQKSKIKKGIAVTLAAASIASMALIYNVSSDHKTDIKKNIKTPHTIVELQQ